MHTHRQRILDHRYHASMVTKARSANPREAAIGRQGQALRAACISSHHVKGVLDPPLIAPSPEHIGSSLKRRDTNLAEPDVDEELRKILNEVPKWEPGSFGRGPNPKCAPTYNNILGQSIRREFPKPDPTKREPSQHENNMRLFGGSYWFNAPDPTRERQCYSHLPLEEQKKVIRSLSEPNLIMHYPHWTKPKCKGIGRYRMAAELPQVEHIRGLVGRMGEAPDVLGVLGDLPIEGFEGLTIHSLLCVRNHKEISEKLQGPTEDTVNDMKVDHGFPVPMSLRLKSAETYLKPLTYAAFCFQPYDKVSDHRLVHNYCWRGKDCDQKLPNEMNLVNTFPEPPSRDEPNLPEPVGFTNGSQPSYIELPARHPHLKDSDLEALPSNPVPISKPRPKATTTAAIGRQATTNTTRRVSTAGRPALERRTSDKGPRMKKTKTAALGKKRATSAVQLAQYHARKETFNVQADAIQNGQAKDKAMEIPIPSDDASEFEDVDSPPAKLLSISYKENNPLSERLRREEEATRSVRKIASRRPPAKSLSSQTLADRPGSSSIYHSCQNTLVQPGTAAIQISRPTTPEVPRSPSVEERNKTLSDRSKRHVRWESNLVHTSEQGGCNPHSIYNYSKSSKSSSPRYVHVEAATPCQASFRDKTNLMKGKGLMAAEEDEEGEEEGEEWEEEDLPHAPNHEIAGTKKLMELAA